MFFGSGGQNLADFIYDQGARSTCTNIDPKDWHTPHFLRGG